MIREKKILVIVPARGGSKGIRKKNIYPVLGKPLINYTDELITSCNWVDYAVVSTDDPNIGNVSLLNFDFIRPSEISGDGVSDFPVVEHALRECEHRCRKEFDIILLLQPTSPMRTETDLLAAINKLIDGSFDSLMSVSETDSKGHPFKQFILHNETIKHWAVEGEKIITRQELSTTYHKDGIVYAFTRECITNQKSIFGRKHTYQITKRKVVNIDTIDDIRYFEYLLNNNNHD
jgi:CMP-N,N'-diacetyllegionaminic acid synthase